jgi:hypothetical protein
VSAHTAFETIDTDHSLSLRLRPHADQDYNYRYDWLTQQAHTQPHKQLSTILKQEFSDKFIAYLLADTAQTPPVFDHLPLSGEMQVSQLSKTQKSTIADLLGN